MIYLLFSVICSTLILVIFKGFTRFGITNIYAIVTNYAVAATLGFLSGGFSISVPQLLAKEWLLGAFLIGFLFVSLFQIMALGAQTIGVSRVSVPVKMSVVLPVLAGVWLYNEKLSFGGIVGVFLALIAVYFGTKKTSETAVKNMLWLLLLPAVLFFGNGSIDVLLKYAQVNWIAASEIALFSSILFGSAFIWGLLFAAKTRLANHIKPTVKDVLAGIALGIPNYGSIYFLLQALDKSGLPSASVYPINNVAVVSVSAILGMTVYREHLSKINLIGLACGIISIVLIASA